MNVRELREILSQLPDNMQVVTYIATTESIAAVESATVIDETLQGSARRWIGALLIDTEE